MNDALARFALEIDLAASANEALRLRFGLACCRRADRYLEDPEVIACLQALGDVVEGRRDRAALASLAEAATRLARSHRGSASLDGAGHAAVSASHAVAQALAGRALQAADYAAYAVVYGEGGYGAVTEGSAFAPELEWQLACIQELRRGT